MTEEHPNISVLKKLNPANVAETVDVLVEDIVFIISTRCCRK